MEAATMAAMTYRNTSSGLHMATTRLRKGPPA